jgi:uncharacterized membrane protein YhaH (DUF805 family)
MGFGKRLGSLLADPRGRMSRQDLLVAATFMTVLDFGLGSLAEGPALYAIKVVAYWIVAVGVVKRLHDIGHSGWWLAGGLSIICMWSAVIGLSVGLIVGVEALQPGSPIYVGMLAVLLLPALGMTLWLHLAPGEPGMNRHGPEPEGILAGIVAPAAGGAAQRG